MTESEWQNIRQIVNGLWPKVEFTDAQRQEFEHRLKKRQASIVESAVRDHFALDERRKTPTLARIIDRCKAAAESKYAAPRNKKGENADPKKPIWRAMWTDNGRPVVGNQHFASKQSVIYTHGNSVTPLMLGKDSSEEMDEREAKRDDAIALEEIRSWKPDRLQDAIGVAVAAGCIQDIARHDPEAWTRHERGFIAAADWMIRTQPGRAQRIVDAVGAKR